MLTVPIASAEATSEDSSTTLLSVSRIITGTDDLSPAVAQRVQILLSARISGFVDKLSDLSKALSQDQSHDAALAALTSEQVDFALDIAKPWYVGYVGKPSNTILKDDAEFVTFLQAQSYQKFLDLWPRPSYPEAGPGWWVEPPANAGADEMPEAVKSWSFQPSDMPTTIKAPDPAWAAYVTKKYPTIEAAQAALGKSGVPLNNHN